MKEIKELVANDNLRIQLHDHISQNLKELLVEFNSENFSKDTKYSETEFKKRIEKCEDLTDELCKVQALLGYWGTDKQDSNFSFPIKSLSNQLKGQRENEAWRAVKWYPVTLLFYFGGVLAVASENYHKLFQLFQVRVTEPGYSKNIMPLNNAIVSVNYGNVEHAYSKLLKKNNHNYPLSEYIYIFMKNKLADFLFLGSIFDKAFNSFEILSALEYINKKHEDIPQKAWGPVGRFAYDNYHESNLLLQMLLEADEQKNNWLPIKAGFFNGDIKRFEEVSSSFKERLNWFI